MRSHLGGVKSKGVLSKHLEEHHKQEDHDDPSTLFTMKRISSHKTVLQRLVAEGVEIQNTELKDPGILMNSKAEWGRGKLVRFEPTVQRI